MVLSHPFQRTTRKRKSAAVEPWNAPPKNNATRCRVFWVKQTRAWLTAQRKKSSRRPWRLWGRIRRENLCRCWFSEVPSKNNQKQPRSPEPEFRCSFPKTKRRPKSEIQSSRWHNLVLQLAGWLEHAGQHVEKYEQASWHRAPSNQPLPQGDSSYSSVWPQLWNQTHKVCYGTQIRPGGGIVQWSLIHRTAEDVTRSQWFCLSRSLWSFPMHSYLCSWEENECHGQQERQPQSEGTVLVQTQFVCSAGFLQLQCPSSQLLRRRRIRKIFLNFEHYLNTWKLPKTSMHLNGWIFQGWFSLTVDHSLSFV